MTVLDQITMPRAGEVQTEALSALISSLGLAKAAFFLRDHLARPTDSVALKDDLFGNETVADLVSQIEAERNS